MSAQAFSGADLLHGPLAMIDPQVPVLTVVADGVGGRRHAAVLPRLAEFRRRRLLVGTPGGGRRGPDGSRCPPACREELSPMLEILPVPAAGPAPGGGPG